VKYRARINYNIILWPAVTLEIDAVVAFNVLKRNSRTGGPNELGRVISLGVVRQNAIFEFPRGCYNETRLSQRPGFIYVNARNTCFPTLGSFHNRTITLPRCTFTLSLNEGRKPPAGFYESVISVCHSSPSNTVYVQRRSPRSNTVHFTRQTRPHSKPTHILASCRGIPSFRGAFSRLGNVNVIASLERNYANCTRRRCFLTRALIIDLSKKKKKNRSNARSRPLKTNVRPPP